MRSYQVLQLWVSGTESNVYEEVLHISQSSTTEASPSDDSVSYLGRSLRVRSLPSTEMQSVYSTTPVNWTVHC